MATVCKEKPKLGTAGYKTLMKLQITNNPISLRTICVFDFVAYLPKLYWQQMTSFPSFQGFDTFGINFNGEGERGGFDKNSKWQRCLNLRANWIIFVFSRISFSMLEFFCLASKSKKNYSGETPDMFPNYLIGTSKVKIFQTF